MLKLDSVVRGWFQIFNVTLILFYIIFYPKVKWFQVSQSNIDNFSYEVSLSNTNNFAHSPMITHKP